MKEKLKIIEIISILEQFLLIRVENRKRTFLKIHMLVARVKIKLISFSKKKSPGDYILLHCSVSVTWFNYSVFFLFNIENGIIFTSFQKRVLSKLYIGCYSRKSITWSADKSSLFLSNHYINSPPSSC